MDSLFEFNMLKKDYIKFIQNKLFDRYSEPHLFLEVKNPLESMIATILSAQCTDARVNQVVSVLFKKYKSVEDYANADINEFEKDIKSTGFYRNKAKNIINSCRIILQKHNGVVPKEMDKLVALPGIGRKTANIVLSNGYGIVVGIPIDTHMKRTNFRLGLTKNKDPDNIEQDLIKIIPRDKWFHYAFAGISLGREFCRAPTPICSKCFLKGDCKKIGVKNKY